MEDLTYENLVKTKENNRKRTKGRLIQVTPDGKQIRHETPDALFRKKAVLRARYGIEV